jgi:hypothetical protein
MNCCLGSEEETEVAVFGAELEQISLEQARACRTQQ